MSLVFQKIWGFTLYVTQNKRNKSLSFCLILTFTLAGLCGQAKEAAQSSLLQQSTAEVTKQTSNAASALDLACDKIANGDFAGAWELIHQSAAFNSNAGLRQLEKIIDEYMTIEDRREILKNEAYQEQLSELDELRQEDFIEDVNTISKVLAIVSKALEYCDDEELEQVLLDEPLVKNALEQAEQIAFELELEGKWLDAYKHIYSKLELIYKDNEYYSEYSQGLLEKAEILTFIQDSPCESCQDRSQGVEKQTFINAVDFLDAGYVRIIDYRPMTISAINQCKLLAEVANNPNIESRYRISDTQYASFMAVLTAIQDEISRIQANITKEGFISIFEQILTLSDSPVDGIQFPQALLIIQFAKGALSALDPYTIIFWPSEAKTFEKKITNQFTGIGIRFEKKDEFAKVLSVLPDTPAYYCGFRAGDVIQAVDGVETKQMSANCVADSISGPDGSEVTITIKHHGDDKNRDVTIQRAKITVPSILGWQKTETGQWQYMIDPENGIGYIHIKGFNSRTVEDFDRTLAQLETHGIEGLILDMRSNLGGLLSGALEIADRFIKKGLIARVQPRFGMPTYISACKEKTHPDYPMVVLIDGSTASSAEILTGILQEPKYNRATIVGQRSYGKSSVQSILNHLKGGAKLKYTTAYYYLPSGQIIRNRDVISKQGQTDWGITPDVQVELLSAEQKIIADIRKMNESATKEHFDNAQRLSNRETIEADPQLATGLLVLKSKMIKSGINVTLD